MIKTTCGNCPTGCGLKVFVRDREVVDVFGDEEHPANKGSLCPKGLLALEHPTNPHRLVHPRIRESLDEPFAEVTWSEAIAFTARKLAASIEESGPESVFIHGTECDPFDYLAGAALFARLTGTSSGPSRFFPKAFSPYGDLQKMFGVPGSRLLMNAPRDWCNSRCILLYGCDLAASDPVTMGSLIDARDRGATLVAIDSKKSVTTSKATVALRIKPGSGATLLKGILRAIIGMHLVNTAFLRECTEGFEDLKALVEPFTPEIVAESCWIGIEELHRTAESIGGRHPVQVVAGDWFSRRYLTDEELALCGALVAINGSPGVSGGGLNLLAATSFTWSGDFPGMPAEESGGKISPEPLHLETALLDPNHPIGSLIWQGNSFAGLTGGDEVQNALRKVPLIVHLSLFPNASFHHAHVSFPVTSWMEQSGLLATNNGRSLQWQNKVLDAPGECRPALDFWRDLADASKPGSRFSRSIESLRESNRDTADFFLKENPLTSRIQIRLLDPEVNPPGGILWPCTEERDLEFEVTRLIRGNVRGKNILFQNGQNHPFSQSRFPTPSGKILLSVGSRATPTREEDEDPELPLLLCTGVLVDYVEDYGCFVSGGKPDVPRFAAVKIHPLIARLLDVTDGDLLTVENERGTLSAPALLSVEIDPRTLWYPYGADNYQIAFRGPSASRLFRAPASGAAVPSRTRVTAHGAKQDRDRANALIKSFIETLESGSRRQ